MASVYTHKKHFYTETLLTHAQISFYTQQTFTRNIFYTQQAFTHSKCLDTEHLHTQYLHTVLLHMASVYTQTFPHRKAAPKPDLDAKAEKRRF